MKNTVLLLLLFTITIISTSCSNDDDRVIPIDQDTIASTFEITVSSFNAANNYLTNIAVPQKIKVLDSDVALVYILDRKKSTSIRDIWNPLPKTIIFEDGKYVRYTYNFLFNLKNNIADLEIFLENNNPNNLSVDITDNQDFRIVIVPSQFLKNTKIDVSDFCAVQSALELNF